MSIERRHNKHKRSVRTLIVIATLVPIVFGGARLGTIILFILCILDILLQTTERARGLLRSYRTLLSCSCCDSIDIKVFQTFGPYSRAAPSCKSCTSWPSCFRQKKRAEHIKVLTDLVLLFLLRCYRHSGPIGPGVHPVHPVHPANPASDAEKARRGTGPRPTKKRLGARSARACPSQCNEKKRTPHPVARGPVPRTLGNHFCA